VAFVGWKMTDLSIPLMLEGQLDERSLADVLLELSRHRATGILTIQGDSDILAISVLEGDIVSTDSLNRTLEEGLGEVVEEKGWVTAENYASLASEYRSGGGRVVDLLVERDHLTERQLGLALREHIYRLGLDAFRWQGGEFKFYAGDEVSYEPCVQPIAIEEFVVRASRTLGSMGPLDGGVGTRATPYRRTPDLPPMKDANTLVPAEQWLMHELERPMSVGALVDRGEYDEFKVLFYLWRLERRGVLQRGQDLDSSSAGLDSSTPLRPLETAPEPETISLPEVSYSGGDVLSLEGAAARAESSPSDSILSSPSDDSMAEVIELPRIQQPEPEVISLNPVGEAPLDDRVISLGGMGVEMPDPIDSAADTWGEEEAEEEERAPRPQLDLSRVTPWLSRGIAGLGTLLLLLGLFSGGDRMVLPFPWHSGQRADLSGQRQASSMARLGEGLRTFFLLNGRFPDDLQSLEAEGWVSARDLVDAEGGALVFSPTASTYVIQSPTSETGAASDWLHQGSITGNFLLDPNLAAFSDPTETPLVLLD